jgi:ATP-dependent exoDNAse (exonuclease V) beta subunit
VRCANIRSYPSPDIATVAVAVMTCDDEVIPLQERIESVADEADLEEVYNTERHLLYVACTRARDHLLVTGVDPASEFLVDLA